MSEERVAEDAKIQEDPDNDDDMREEIKSVAFDLNSPDRELADTPELYQDEMTKIQKSDTSDQQGDETLPIAEDNNYEQLESPISFKTSSQYGKKSMSPVNSLSQQGEANSAVPKAKSPSSPNSDIGRVESPPPPPVLPNSPDQDRKQSGLTKTSSDSSTPTMTQTSALNLVWSCGWNRNLPVFNLCDGERSCILYTCAHAAIIYDYINNKQTLLQAHANQIACVCLSIDKKWLATADVGTNCSLIVWDTHTAFPVQTIFDPDPSGIVAMAMTKNARYIVTLSAGPLQTLAVWDWTLHNDKPLCTAELSEEYGIQTEILFNPENEYQIMSNSETQVIFYLWDNDHIEFFAPPLSDYDFHKPIGRFTQSIFHQGSTRALTATSIGNLVVWSNNSLSKDGNVADKRALKLVKIIDCGIRVLTTVGSLIVMGMSNGMVKFCDQNLMLINWYSEFNFGPISSVSFDSDTKFTGKAEEGSDYPFDATIERSTFIIRNFVLATSLSIIGHVTTNGTITKVIHREHDAEIRALATHPAKSMVVIGSHAGILKLWDYETRETVLTRAFETNTKLSCAEYNQDGSLLAIGTTDGRLYLLDSVTLSNHMPEPFHYARDTITHIKFGNQFLATADAEFTMSLYKVETTPSGKSYIYLARYRAHYKPIRDIMFGVDLDSNNSRLLSLGMDRLLVEYDLENSCVGDLKLLSTDRIEQSAVPTCMTWYPALTKEHFILTSNDQYKFKLYNATTKMCRKTLLGPTFGSPVLQMAVIPKKDANRDRVYMAFVTRDKVGFHIMPLDGNPNNAMALVAHPVGVTNMARSYDGKYIFTAGGSDETMHMWMINFTALDAQSSLGGEDLIPFYQLLEGGREGEMFADLEDYFYYALLRSQGVNENTVRKTAVTIPLYQVPNVMRAMGFYPTEQEIENMMNEIKFSTYVDTGKFVDDIDIGTFLKLYLNHRPAFGLSLQHLFDAFDTLGFPSDIGSVVERADLLDLLQSKGEHMTVYELAEYLTTLLGYNAEGGVGEGHAYDATYAGNIIEEHLPFQVTAEMFSQEILGFSASQHVL